VNGDRQALVAYRLEQAGESLQSARLLLENSKYRSSLSRSYYAMFYAVLALLAVEGTRVSKHVGALSAFDREFVKKDLFEKEMSLWLHEAFDLRQRSDYREMFAVTAERASAVLGNADRFVEAVTEHLGRGGQCT